MRNHESIARIARLIALGMLLALTGHALAQTENTVYRFKWQSDGAWPLATLVADSAGNLYGTTFEGGGSVNCGYDYKTPWGCGSVFELTPPAKEGEGWTESLIYIFTAGADGSNPAGGVVFDQAGNLYGMTSNSGTLGQGTLYQLKPPTGGTGAWTETTLYNFSTSYQGYDAPGYLAFDAAGNLYGFTWGSFGGVFELSPPAGGSGAWTYSQIYTFTGPPGGLDPLGGVAIDSSGNLYGTTSGGGSSTNCSSGCGTVFRLSPPSTSGGDWKETTLYNFQGQPDGSTPAGGVLLGKNGNIFGVTPRGGANGSTYGGYGAVFELAKPAHAGDPWTESVLYSFEGANNGGGGGPIGVLIQDARGNLYGTALPVAFKLSPPSTEGAAWTETSLYNFVDWPGLGEMLGGLTRRTATGNTLYGVTQGGGICNTHQCNGTVFSITP